MAGIIDAVLLMVFQNFTSYHQWLNKQLLQFVEMVQQGPLNQVTIDVLQKIEVHGPTRFTVPRRSARKWLNNKLKWTNLLGHKR